MIFKWPIVLDDGIIFVSCERGIKGLAICTRKKNGKNKLPRLKINCFLNDKYCLDDKFFDMVPDCHSLMEAKGPSDHDHVSNYVR